MPYTLEEAYEVADAIESRDWQELPSELGDLLFQVVFYCQLGKEKAGLISPLCLSGYVISLSIVIPMCLPPIPT